MILIEINETGNFGLSQFPITQIIVTGIPDITEFPAFPDHDEFDLYAIMDPAKVVGGDFYDFYMIDEESVVFLVADVSGKSIPASLFMMRAKTMIRNYVESESSLGEVLTKANSRLCLSGNGWHQIQGTEPDDAAW